VHLVRDEGARRQRPTVRRRRNEAHLRHVFRAHVAEPHRRRRREPDRFHTLAQLYVRFQRCGHLVSREPEIRRAHDDHGHAVIDERHVDPLDAIAHAARRQQRAATASRDVEKIDADARRSAGDPVNSRVAVVTDGAVRRLDVRDGDRSGVDHVDAHGRHVPRNIDDPALDRKGTDGGEHVAAILREVDARFADDDLREEIIDVSIASRRRRNDRDLTRERIRAADPVNLTRIGAERRNQDAIAEARVARQIALEDERPLRRSAAHERAWDRSLAHAPPAATTARKPLISKERSPAA